MNETATIAISLEEQLAHINEAKEIARRMGLTDAYEMECAIERSLLQLKSRPAPAPKVHKITTFNEDAIGHAIRAKVETQTRIYELEDLLRGATQPENIAGYQDQLMIKKEEMKWINSSIIDLKRQHLAFLEQRLTSVDTEMEVHSAEAFELEELKAIRRGIETRMATITAEIKALCEAGK